MRAALLVLALVLAGCTATQTTPTPPPSETVATTTTIPTTTTVAPPPEPGPLRLEPFLSGFTRPILMLEIPDDSGRLVVVEQDGLVKLARDGQVAKRPFADIANLTRAGGERGLLGMAFLPDFAQSGALVLSYTDNEGDSVLARYRVGEDPDAVDPASAEVLLTVDQPYANHNGGHVVFGPDGMLYFGLGDGGAGGDPHGNGQDRDALLGSLLRLDVGATGPYRVPDDNPFGNEVWAKGLRNPWRFSFDRQTGNLFLGDVGQNRWEEIDFLAWPAPGGANFGWNAFEGSRRYSPVTIPFSEPVGPVAEYSHEDGCSVTGGFVLRGASTPSYQGQYVYGDYCSGKVWLLRGEDGAWVSKLALDTDLSISSFAEDAEGDVFVIDHGGNIGKLVEG